MEAIARAARRERLDPPAPIGSQTAATVPMRIASIVLALAALGSGLEAAWKWYLSSKVEIDLGYHAPGLPGGTFRRMGMETPRHPEPLDPERRQENATFATWEAMNQAARLNKEAAVWTAASVVLSALSAVAGAFG